jgi:hypothetical protein
MTKEDGIWSKELPKRGTEWSAYFCFAYADALLKFDADHARAFKEAADKTMFYRVYREAGLIDDQGVYRPK